MDRLAADRLRHLHALLREEIPAAGESGSCSARFTFARARRKRVGFIRRLMTIHIPRCSRRALSPRWEKARLLSAAATALVILVSLSGCIFSRHHDNTDPG